jgi:hypothetical protein
MSLLSIMIMCFGIAAAGIVIFLGSLDVIGRNESTIHGGFSARRVSRHRETRINHRRS